MDLKNKRILEALKMQPLSKEEMEARHILGRLYGPIATCIESTRNGRLYNKPLWEKALKDEIFLEKVATKALFLELGHPADREETDMKQACACIPEVPKIVGDDLYAYVDILDTPNGRLLKTLVDYGFVPGISSRGSGDVMDNNQVDPETFFLETWDIVQLPAVKKARLNVCESLDSTNVKLKQALAESYNAAKEEDKGTMKKALENLNINIDEELDNMSPEVSDDDIPWDPEFSDVSDESDTLVEDTETEEDSEAVETEETAEEPEVDGAETDEEPEEEDAEAAETEEAPETEEDLDDLDTVGDAIKLLQEYDENMRVAFEPIEVDGQELEVDSLSHFVDNDDEENPVLVIGVDCKESDSDASEDTEETEAEDTDEIELEVETEEEGSEEEDNTESAEDSGEDEVIESLKNLIRKNEALETEVSDLRKAKAVGDAKVDELQEKLDRYVRAFNQASAEAAKVAKLQSEVKKLSEHVTQSKSTIKRLTEKVNKAQQLKESVEASKNAEKRLTESVNKLSRENAALEAKLEGQTKEFNAKLQERTNLAKTYKARCIETLTRYVESKATMLSIQPSEITSRLNENYTLADVDAVCDQILDSTVSFSRLPFSGRTKTSARMTESVNKAPRAPMDPAYGYEIDDDLLELAGLKK